MSAEFTIPGMMPQHPVRKALQQITPIDGSLMLELDRVPSDEFPPAIKVAVLGLDRKPLWSDDRMSYVFHVIDGGERVRTLHLPPDTLPVGTSELQALIGAELKRWTLRRTESAWSPRGDAPTEPERITRGIQILLPGAAEVFVRWQPHAAGAGRIPAFQLLDPDGQLPEQLYRIELRSYDQTGFRVGFTPAIPDQSGWQLVYVA